MQALRSERDRQHRVERPEPPRSARLRAGSVIDYPDPPAAIEDLLRAAEAGAAVPQGMNRCVVMGGGFSGAGEEFGLLRVRGRMVGEESWASPVGVRTPVAEINAMPCRVNGEVGILRLPERERNPETNEATFGWKKRLDEEDAHRRREYQDEIERNIRLRLEATERRKFEKNATKMKDLFNRLGNKWATIQDEKIAERKRDIELSKFELAKHAMRRTEQAATKIAAAWKRRKALAQMAWERYKMKRVIRIQRFWRGWVIWKRYRETRRMKREDWLSGRMRAKRKMEVTICKAKVNYRFRKRCGAGKIAAVLARLVRARTAWAWKNWRPKTVPLYFTKATVRIQAWYRGEKVRQEPVYRKVCGS